MNITTVGELVEHLLKFDQTLPVLKSDDCAVCYNQLGLIDVMVFPIKRCDYPGGLSSFVDADPDTGGFNAVIL